MRIPGTDLLTSEEPDVMVYLGTGLVHDFSVFRSGNLEKTVFVEPDPVRAANIRREFEDTPGVAVLETAIACEPGRGILNIANNRRFSSLLPPTGLLEFYPNTRVTESIEVETQTLETLCSILAIDWQKNNLLIIDVGGMEKEILAHASMAALQNFRWIVIRSSDLDLYGPASVNAGQNMMDTLRHAAFTVFTSRENTPPFIQIVCIKNDFQIENEELQRNLKELGRQIEQLEARSEEQKKMIRQSEELLRANAGLEVRLESLTKQKTNLESKVQSLETSLSKKSVEVEEMQRAVRINNKLMLKSNTDYKDLQSQYRKALEHQDRQHVLLCELKEKLAEAAKFYGRLNLEDAVLESGSLDHERSERGSIPDGAESSDH
jgi:FkbM family methyltransferase